MTTIVADRKEIQCPVCLTTTTADALEQSKLSSADLSTIKELLRDSSLMRIIEVGKIASKFFRPETMTADVQLHDSLMRLSDRANEFMEKQRQLAQEFTNSSEEKRAKLTQEAITRQQEIISRFQDEIRNLEQDHKNGITLMTTMLQQIQQKISGVGIGDVRQTTVIRDLKSACPLDEFSDDKAKKGGTDIIAKVMDHGTEFGKIVVSVKEVEKWDGDFLAQAKRNLSQEQTEWGILVTKVFPSSALNEKMYFDTSNGILLVKAEYAPAAYIAIRHAVIYKHQAESWIKNHEESKGLQQQIMEVLQSWVNGDELKKLLGLIDNANSMAALADDLLQKLQVHNEKTLKTARDYQDKIMKCLQQCNLGLAELKEKLPITTPTITPQHLSS